MLTAMSEMHFVLSLDHHATTTEKQVINRS